MNVLATSLDAVLVLIKFYDIPSVDTLTPSSTWVNSVTLEPMVKQLYLSLWLMDAEELQKLSLLFVFQRGDQGATRSAGGGRGSRGPALRGAATAGGELHHPLRYGVSLETLAGTKRCIKIDAYNKLPWSFAPTYNVFSSICLKLIIAHYIKFCVCSRHVPLMFGNQKLSKCS